MGLRHPVQHVRDLEREGYNNRNMRQKECVNSTPRECTRDSVWFCEYVCKREGVSVRACECVDAWGQVCLRVCV